MACLASFGRALAPVRALGVALAVLAPPAPALMASALMAGALVAGAPAADVQAKEPSALVQAGSGRVVEVIDGDTLRLADGAEVRLVGLQAPKLPLGRRNFTAWPLAGEAKAALERLTLGETVTLSYGGQREDRHGRLLAHLHDGDGLWVQGEMLRLGMARVYTFDDNRALAGRMLALEREARAGRRGIWANPYYRLRRPEETGQDIDTFQIVDGRVLDAAVVRGTGYLNFGEDYRSDFTIVVPRKARAQLEEANIDFAALEGRRVRVRGWLTRRNGPMIELTHAEQIELLEE